MFEKLMHSKLNMVADWIIRIIMINILIILFSLPVFTVYAAVSAGYNVFHDYLNQKDIKLFKGFFGYFKQRLVRKIIFQLLLVVVFGLGYLNVRYYTTLLEENYQLFYVVGYYITLAFLAIAYAVMIMSLVVYYINPAMRYRYVIKLSFYLSGKYYFRTLAIVVINSIPMFLLLFPQLMVLFVFAGIGLPLVLVAITTKDIVHYVERLGDQNDPITT